MRRLEDVPSHLVAKGLNNRKRTHNNKRKLVAHLEEVGLDDAKWIQDTPYGPFTRAVMFRQESVRLPMVCIVLYCSASLK